MYNILIIDVVSNCEEICKVAESEFNRIGKNRVHVMFYESPEASWEVFKANPQRYDAVILGTGRDAGNLEKALKLAENVRKINDMTKIIFIGFALNITIDMLRVGGSGYIRIAHLREDVIYVMNRLLDENEKCCRQDHSILSVKQGSYIRILRQSQIMYVEKSRTGIEVTTDEGKFRSPVRFEEFMKESDGNFCLCRCNVCVNFRFVSGIDREYLYMDDGKVIRVSRSHLKDVREHIRNYQCL